jgi:hypothetical protein
MTASKSMIPILQRKARKEWKNGWGGPGGGADMHISHRYRSATGVPVLCFGHPNRAREAHHP